MADELRRTRNIRVEAIPFALSHPGVGTEPRKAVGDRGVEVTSLVNAGGFGTLTPFVDADPERLAAMIAGDVTAPVLLTAAFVPQLLSAINGFIINVASVSAYFPHQEWLYTVPQKAFVRASVSPSGWNCVARAAPRSPSALALPVQSSQLGWGQRQAC